MNHNYRNKQKNPKMLFLCALCVDLYKTAKARPTFGFVGMRRRDILCEHP